MNINFENLVNQVKPSGVIHVGANTCQELPLYLANGIENRLWIEADRNIPHPSGERVINIAIGDMLIGNDMMYKANNNGESSSLLRPLKHIELYQEIDFSQTFVYTDVITMEKLIQDIDIESVSTLTDRTCFNYLVLDIQGMELRALQGLGKFDNHFDVIITEAYTEELYRGCGKLHEIEAFLSNYKLVEFAEEIGKGWGDAAFIRKDLICE
jgi:hypothetical protein